MTTLPILTINQLRGPYYLSTLEANPADGTLEMTRQTITSTIDQTLPLFHIRDSVSGTEIMLVGMLIGSSRIKHRMMVHQPSTREANIIPKITPFSSPNLFPSPFLILIPVRPITFSFRRPRPPPLPPQTDHPQHQPHSPHPHPGQSRIGPSSPKAIQRRMHQRRGSCPQKATHEVVRRRGRGGAAVVEIDDEDIHDIETGRDCETEKEEQDDGDGERRGRGTL